MNNIKENAYALKIACISIGIYLLCIELKIIWGERFSRNIYIVTFIVKLLLMIAILIAMG
jgi:hypothetical protein